MFTATAANVRWLRPLLAQLVGAVFAFLPVAGTLGLGGSAAVLAGRLLSLGVASRARPAPGPRA